MRIGIFFQDEMIRVERMELDISQIPFVELSSPHDLPKCGIPKVMNVRDADKAVI